MGLLLPLSRWDFSKKVGEWKIFLLGNCLKWHGVNFGWKERFWTLKRIFLKLSPYQVFWGWISEFKGSFPLREEKLCDVMSPKTEKLTNSNFMVKCVQRKLLGPLLTCNFCLIFWSIKRPFWIPVAHFDQNRTIIKVSILTLVLIIVRIRGKPNSLTRDNFKWYSEFPDYDGN